MNEKSGSSFEKKKTRKIETKFQLFASLKNNLFHLKYKPAFLPFLLNFFFQFSTNHPKEN